MPIVTAVLGATVALIGVATVRTDGRKRLVLSLVVVVLGFAIIVLGYLVKDIVLGDMVAYYVDGPVTKIPYNFGFEHGFGQYLSMFGGILAIAGGVVSVFKGRI